MFEKLILENILLLRGEKNKKKENLSVLLYQFNKIIRNVGRQR